MFKKALIASERQSHITVLRNPEDYEGNGARELYQNGEVLRGKDGTALTDKGLLYCGKCRTLKQTRIYSPLLGRLYEPMCLCDCETELKAKMDRELADARLRLRVERIKHSADPLLLQNTFANDKFPDSAASRLCRDYLSRFDSFFYPRGVGFYLCGGVGAGKTFYACCIANGVAEKGYTVRALSVNRMLNDLFSTTDKTAYIRSLTEADLLVIDDLGTQRRTGYASEQVFTLIDERYKSKKPLIITSNLPYDSLRREKDITEQRIGDRLVQMCIPVEMEGESRRQAPFSR